MAGLGLRYCPQHPSVPMVLTSSGREWRCDENGCAHSELSGTRRHGHARTLTGQAISRRGVERGQRAAISAVERAAIAREAKP